MSAFERSGEPLGNRQARQPDIGRAHDLALAHRNAALDLREVFADPDLDDQFLDLAERAGIVHPLGVGRELAHRFDIGGEPGKSVRGALLAVEQPVDRTIFDHDKLAHCDLRVGKQRFGCPGGFARQGDEFDSLPRVGRLVCNIGRLRSGPVTDDQGRIRLRVQCTNATPLSDIPSNCR